MIDIDALLPEPEQLRWRGRDFTLRKGIPLSLVRAMGQPDADDVGCALAVIAYALGISVEELEELDPTDNEVQAMQAAISSGTEEMGGSSASPDSSPDGVDR